MEQMTACFHSLHERLKLLLLKIFAGQIRSDCISCLAHEGLVHGALYVSVQMARHSQYLTFPRDQCVSQ